MSLGYVSRIHVIYGVLKKGQIRRPVYQKLFQKKYSQEKSGYANIM